MYQYICMTVYISVTVYFRILILGVINRIYKKGEGWGKQNRSEVKIRKNLRIIYYSYNIYIYRYLYKYIRVRLNKIIVKLSPFKIQLMYI